MTDRDLANANVLNYVSECWVVVKDGVPIMALTNEQAAKECMYSLGGFGCAYVRITPFDLPQHYKQGC